MTVSGEAPLVRDISGKHGVAVGGFAVASSGNRVVVIATIDNLLKGAASQAMQNINLSLVVTLFLAECFCLIFVQGYDEYAGIPLD